jgi:hypothetical protein
MRTPLLPDCGGGKVGALGCTPAHCLAPPLPPLPPLPLLLPWGRGGKEIGGGRMERMAEMIFDARAVVAAAPDAEAEAALVAELPAPMEATTRLSAPALLPLPKLLLLLLLLLLPAVLAMPPKARVAPPPRRHPSPPPPAASGAEGAPRDSAREAAPAEVPEAREDARARGRTKTA